MDPVQKDFAATGRILGRYQQTVFPSDQQMLGDYFYNRLKEELSKSFTLVGQPGPGVLMLQVAIVNATTATPI